MSRTVKIVIAVVLAVAAVAAVVGLVGLAVAHNNGVVFGPRQMMGSNGFRLPGQMGGALRIYGFGPRRWGAFMVLPWFSLLLVIALAVVLLVWRPWQAAPAHSVSAGGTSAGLAPGGAPASGTPAAGVPAGTREQFEQWHREMHAQGLAHGAPATETATTAVSGEPVAAPQPPVADEGGTPPAS